MPAVIKNNDTPYQTRLKVWGTSRAVRIPKYLCDHLGIASDSIIELEEASDERGAYLMMRPVADHRSFSDAPMRSMDDLFAGYEGAYAPREADWGEDVGAEVIA